MYETYECDGCGFQSMVSEEVEDHIFEVNTLPNGELKPVDQIVCWGVLTVGSELYLQYKVHGIHPMTTVFQEVKTAYEEYQRKVSQWN